jgi:hypothetical protein
MRLESVKISPASAGFPLMQAEIGAATYLVPPVQPIGAAQAAGTTPPATPGTTPPTTTANAGAAQ